VVRCVLLALVCCTGTSPELDAGAVDASSCVPFTAEATFRIVGVPDVLDGRVEGADLDGLDTVEGDLGGCGMPDGVDPIDRQRGIDNRFAVLKPNLDALLEESNVDDILRARDVQLHVRVEPSDACVRVTLQIDDTIARGEGRVDDEGNVRAELDGRWRAIGLLAETDAWDIGDLSIRVDRDMTRAMLAGSQDITPWITITDGLETPPEIRDSILESIHDLHPDDEGVCRAMSLGFIAEPI